MALLKKNHTDIVNQTKSLSVELERRREIVYKLSEQHRIAIENLAVTNRDLNEKTRCVSNISSQVKTEASIFEDLSTRREIEQESMIQVEAKAKSSHLAMKRIEHELETHETRHHDFLQELRGLEKELDSSRQKREQQLEQLGQEKEKLRKTVLFRDEAKDALSESRLQWSATRRSIETEQRQLERESRELKDLSGQIRNSTWCCCSSHRVRRERLLLSIISLTRQHTHTGTTRRDALANELKLFRDQVQAESLRFEDMTEEMRSWKETRHAERISLSSMRRELESELIRAAETLALHDQRALKLKRLEKRFDSVRSAEMRYRLEKQNAERQLDTSRKASVSSRDKIRTLRLELAESQKIRSNLQRHNTDLSDKLSCAKTSEKHRGNRTRRLQVEFERMRIEHEKTEEALVCSSREIDMLKRRTVKKTRKYEDVAEEMNRLRMEVSEYVFFC